jgi:hypothetical protein
MRDTILEYLLRKPNLYLDEMVIVFEDSQLRLITKASKTEGSSFSEPSDALYLQSRVDPTGPGPSSCGSPRDATGHPQLTRALRTKLDGAVAIA